MSTPELRVCDWKWYRSGPTEETNGVGQQADDEDVLVAARFPQPVTQRQDDGGQDQRRGRTQAQQQTLGLQLFDQVPATNNMELESSFDLSIRF